MGSREMDHRALVTLYPPSPALAGLVEGVVVARDPAGVHARDPIRVCPRPGAILSVNLGRPNVSLTGGPAPMVALTGLHTATRTWRSFADTYLVMALLSAAGVARVFPSTGEAAGAVVEAGAIVGDGATRSLTADCVSAARSPRAVAEVVQRWLMRRAAQLATRPRDGALFVALEALGRGERVDAAARHGGLHRRHLHRLVREHLGVGPKVLSDVARLHRSVGAVQAGSGDPLNGYADQAHQVRDWRRRLDVTPGAYGPRGRSDLARAMSADPRGAPNAFYL